MKKLVTITVFLSLTLVVQYSRSQSGTLMFNLKDEASRAEFLYQQGNYKAAIPLLKTLYQQTKDRQIVLKLATANARLRNYKEAIRYYGTLLPTDTLTVNQRLTFAQCLHQTGKITEAREQYELYLAQSGRKASLPEDLGKENLTRFSLRYSIQGLTVNTSYNEFSPVLLGNNLFFSSDRLGNSLTREDLNQHAGNLDIYQASPRSTVRFTYPEPLKGINSGQHEGPLTADTLGNLYFVRTTPDQHFSLYQTRLEPNGQAQPDRPVNIPFKGNIMHPAVSPDGSYLIFASDAAGGYGGLDLYISELRNDRWTEPLNLGKEVNTPGNESFPHISPEKVYFATDGRIGLGGLDIYSGYRSGNKLVGIENIGAPVNSSSDDFGLIIAPDGGYFVSNRSGCRGGDDIFRLDFHIITLAGRVLDSTNNNPIENVQVTLKGNGGEQSATTDKYGKYSFKIYPGEEYKLGFKASQDYRYRTESFSTIEGKPYGPRPLTTALERKAKLFVLGRVRLANLQRSYEPKVLVIEQATGLTDSVAGSARGSFEAELDRESKYVFLVQCNDQGGIVYFETPEEYDASLSYYLNVQLKQFFNYKVVGQVLNANGPQPVSLWISNQTTGQKQQIFAVNGQFSFMANSLCSYQLCAEQGTSSNSIYLPEGWEQPTRPLTLDLLTPGLTSAPAEEGLANTLE